MIDFFKKKSQVQKPKQMTTISFAEIEEEKQKLKQQKKVQDEADAEEFYKDMERGFLDDEF